MAFVTKLFQGILKGVKVTLCSMKCVNPKESKIKILVIYYSYHKIIENEENFGKHNTKIVCPKVMDAKQLNFIGENIF